MKATDVPKIRKELEKKLDSKRYEHTLGVAYTAAALAMKYGEDPNKAILAGLLHDCAKCMSNEKRIKICREHQIPINEAEQKNPFLLHAKAGSFLAEKKYGVSDRDVLNAVLYHTTGRPEMTLLEKIIYIADYMEPGRKQAPRLEEIRKMAFEDLDRALLWILEDTLHYLESGKMEIDEMTRNTYQYYYESLGAQAISLACTFPAIQKQEGSV